MAINPNSNASTNRPKWLRISERLPPPNWPALYKMDFAHAAAHLQNNPGGRVNSSEDDEPMAWLSVLA